MMLLRLVAGYLTGTMILAVLSSNLLGMVVSSSAMNLMLLLIVLDKHTLNIL
jgi:hypothetical protein